MEGDQGTNRMKMQTVQLLPDEQLVALHQQMIEKEVSCQQKLQTSQEAQHRQAVLIQKLQAKVIQYRNWCQELEQQLKASRGSCPRPWDHKEEHSLEKALIQLEEEQQRYENLAGMNILLREHLDKANEVNEALREDINKLTADWIKAKEELELKEKEWHKEQEHFDRYMRAEHDRILGIWRQVVRLRRYFLEMKTATDRDLSELHAEQVRLSGTILVSCFRLNSDQRSLEARRLGSPELKIQQQHFNVMLEKTDQSKDVCQKPQSTGSRDFLKEELHSRVMELTALLEQSQKQNEEKEKTVKALGDTVEILEANRLELEYEHSLMKDANEEILSLQNAIKEIIKMNACDPAGAVILVRDVLTKRSNKVQHLKHQLLASQNSVSSLEKQREQQEEQCTSLRQRLQQLEGEQDSLTVQVQHFQSLVETLRSGQATLEKSRDELQQQLEILGEEARHLRQSNTQLQLKGDTEDREKEDKLQEMERVLRDRDYIQKRLNALEEKHSLLKNELVTKGEALEKCQLDGELVKQEKHELALALEQAEQTIADLTMAQNKLRSEVADLRDVTAKMSALNESLALDKVDLNQLLLKLEQENQSLLKKVDNLEEIRMSSQKQLNQTERINKELHLEKMQLEQLLHKAEMMQENLQEELRVSRAEQKETHDELSQAHRQWEASRTDLEEAHQESSRLQEVLTKVSKENESLTREKAALEVRLEAAERERQTLTDQMAEIRSAKEFLESSLFQAQQQVSQLEVTNDQLEIQVQTISQAKEVIQGEVKCLCIELEAEKAKVEQERRDKTEQLLEAELKYQETLNHFQTVHKEEMNTIFQELESERERHCAELQVVLERMAKEKEEIESVHDRNLLNLQQEISAVQTQMEVDLIKAQKDKQEELLERESERKSLLEELTQTKEKLTSTCQQLKNFHQEMKMHEEQKQIALQNLEAKLKDARTTMEMLEGKHKEEIKSLKENINLLLQQRDALQNQVQDLESQLSMEKDSCQLIRLEAQKHLREVQRLSKQKALEIAELQKKLEAEWEQREEMNHQKTQLQSQKEEIERWNIELRVTLQKQQEEEQNLNKELQNKQKEVERLNKELQNKQEEVEHQLATVQVLEREKGQWLEEESKNSEQHAVLQGWWKEAECQNKELQSQKRQAELQNVELQHQKEELESQNAELKSMLHRQQEEAEQETRMLRSRWEEAQQRYSEIQRWKEKSEHQNTELQSILRSQQEELECKNMELQMRQKEIHNQNAAVQRMNMEQNQREEMARQSTELKAKVQVLEQERASLAVSLKEKEVKLKSLQDSDCAHQGEITKLNTALQEAQQLLADHRTETQELSSQMQSLRQAMLEKEAVLVAHKEKLAQDLEESHTNEQHLRDSVKMLEAEISRLRLNLSGTESKREALALEYQRACSAHWEAQSQLTKLRSVLQYMLCSDFEEKLEHGGRGDRSTGNSTSTCKEQDNVKGMALLQLKDLSTELTVERVAEAIQDLRQNVWHARRERDEIRKNSEKLKQELNEKEAESNRINAKAQELQKWLNQSQEEKMMADGKCISLESALKVEVIAFKEENVTLRAKVTTLEKSLENAEKQKKDALNERGMLQMAKEKMVCELDLLRESVTASEIRANAMEKMNQSLEQELQAALSTLRIKQEEVETQQERLMTLEQEAKVEKGLQGKLDHLTATIAKRDEEIKSHLKQISDLERHRGVQMATIEHLTKDVEKKIQEFESQKSKFEELGKQNKIQTAALGKLNLDLEEGFQTMKSQKEKIQKLEELTQSQRAVIESLTLNLEEKVKETQFKEEKIQIMEENESSQIGVLLKDVDELKTQLSEKDWELISQKQLLQEREKQGEKKVKAVQTSLEHMKAILRDKEREVESQKEQITSLQQREIQRETQLHELLEKVKNVTFILTQRDQELQSQKEKIREMEEEMEMELKALRELLAKTQATLKEKDKEMEFQEQHLEIVERQVKDLFEDIQCSTVALKGRDDSIEEEKKKHLKKQEDELQLQETVLATLGQIKVVLRRREQAVESLKEQHEDHNKETDRQLRGMQVELQEAEQALRNKESVLESLNEKIRQLQQREEVAVTQTKSVLEKLESSKSCLQDRDQEIESLQGRVQELSRLIELKENNIVTLQQDLDRINQITKEKEGGILKQAKQISTYLLEVETTQAELQACKNQVSHLEEVIRKRDHEGNFQKCQHRHEQANIHHLQVLGDKKHPEEEDETLEDQKEQVRRNGLCEREQKQMNDEIKELQENIQNLQHMLEEKDDEVKQERGKVKQLEDKIGCKEEQLLTCSERLKRIISALRLQDSELDNVESHIQKLLVLKEEEAVRRKSFQEKDQKLKWQKEKIQQLEEEKRVKEEELDRIVAVLNQTESAEIEWKEKAQRLDLSLSQSEEALKAMRKEMGIMQTMVSERDKDRFHLQEQLNRAFRAMEEERHITKALTGDVDLLPRENGLSEIWSKEAGESVKKEGELTWAIERRLLYRRLKLLQEAVARLENDKQGLEQHNIQLRGTLEQVERERRRLKRTCGDLSLNCSLSQTDSGPPRIPALAQEETLYKQLVDFKKQVSVLQMQLSLERKQKQDYINSCAKTSQEISGLHQELSESLSVVARDPEAMVLASETRKLDETLNNSLALANISWGGILSEKYPISSTPKTVQHKGSR
ncbi:centrosome-associated protein CEP250 isoform X2 [Paroedura picta]|uniref:centrosome-associated protein CEP250 isoform X2 n=1 Tax=Paroedura picta TaxID=143630 RepID=UPI004056141F